VFHDTSEANMVDDSPTAWKALPEDLVLSRIPDCSENNLSASEVTTLRRYTNLFIIIIIIIIKTHFSVWCLMSAANAGGYVMHLCPIRVTGAVQMMMTMNETSSKSYLLGIEVEEFGSDGACHSDKPTCIHLAGHLSEQQRRRSI